MLGWPLKVYCMQRGMVSSVLSHIGPWSFRSRLRTEITKDRSDQGPNRLSHFDPKDRSARALRQTGIGVRMDVHRRHYSDAG